MKKKGPIFIALVVLSVSSSALIYIVWRSGARNRHNYSGTEASARQVLIDHYNPSTCYGMPPGTGEPWIKIEKDGDNWEYVVADGNCCEVTKYEGMLIIRDDTAGIDEARSYTENVPC